MTRQQLRSWLVWHSVEANDRRRYWATISDWTLRAFAAAAWLELAFGPPGDGYALAPTWPHYFRGD